MAQPLSLDGGREYAWCGNGLSCRLAGGSSGRNHGLQSNWRVPVHPLWLAQAGGNGLFRRACNATGPQERTGVASSRASLENSVTSTLFGGQELSFSQACNLKR